ncbi:MAG: nitroreductase family protein [Solidesulfovibrio sp.]|uniref:nitroreductase family protein n=1 Tax=Solidesulfovibrio sp. TaxID=2910990 RepID=UPI002B2011E3|nr:nitroreductase family protein [Solidesulfovibrio sp.]MEA4854809.1 nitroreductase family protein [Solidesulfovibrio sp.]
MAQPVPRIDPEACLGCGACARACPAGVLSFDGRRAVVAGSACIGCGQCRAVCPAEAVALPEAENFADGFATFTPPGTVVAPGEFSPEELVDLLRSRRSCRCYTEAAVSGPLLEDLVRAAVTAPSGTNSQAWTFSVLTSRAAVVGLGEAVAGFYRRLNKLAANAFFRKAYALLGRSELENYFREYYASVAAALAMWDRDRTDRLFHGATAAIIIGSRPGASCPAEDALLAAQNMLLVAHALGLGTCLIGYAVEAMRHDGRVKAAAGLPREESVHAVVALGWPDVVYARQTSRRRPLVRYKTA